MRHWARLVGLVGVLWTVAPMASARGDDCGNEPVACGSPIVHPCYCGDTVRWNYTLSGTLTNRGSGTSPCTTSVGLLIADGVTLSGDGTAHVAGSGGSGSIGISFNETQNATLTSASGYFQVSGFERGVKLEENSTGNVVENVESYSNGSGSGAYGIDLRTGATGNTVQDVWVHHNGDEGIHLGGGSGSNTVQNSLFECNAVEQIYLVESDGNLLQGNTAISGKNDVSVCSGAVNNATMKVHNSDSNTFKGNTFLYKLVFFTAGATGNVFGTATSGEGNTITGARLEFQQGQDGGGTWLPAYNNTVTNVSMSGTSNACVNFKKHADSPNSALLPYGNKVTGSTLNCTGSGGGYEIIALNDSGAGTANGQNYVCASSCNGSTCTNSDANDQLNIITVQSSACP